MAPRRLSPEERELWRRVAETATPLRPDAPGKGSSPEPDAGVASPPRAMPEPPAAVRLPPSPRRPTPTQAYADLVPDPHAALDRAHPHMDRRRYDKLRRGRVEPQARLDLHGMTADRAHGALAAFILGAHAAGLRLVLVITGKGRPGGMDALAPHRHGVLRHNVPHWLAAPPLASKVLQIAPAHVRHGGGGAYYVYLRRLR